MNGDPLNILYAEYGYKPGLITQIVKGEKYTAVMLNDGSIGICGNDMDSAVAENIPEDISDTGFRVLYNAYLNALLNYRGHTSTDGNILDLISDNKGRRIVMVGFFRPLVERALKLGIEMAVFDKARTENVIKPQESMPEVLKDADLLILSSTTISNGSFSDIVNSAVKADIHLLGPSSTLDPIFFFLPNITVIHGMLFDKYDSVLLDKIGQGSCTPEFSHELGHKVYISRATKV